MIPPPDLSKLTETEKDALILALWAQVQTLTARVAELDARLSQPPKTPGNSSLPPSKGHKANRPEKAERAGPRQGSLGRAGGGRALAEEPDQLVIAKAAACAHCRAALGDADQVPCAGRVAEERVVVDVPRFALADGRVVDEFEVTDAQHPHCLLRATSTRRIFEPCRRQSIS